VKALLTGASYRDLCHGISEVFDAMVEELRFRQFLDRDLFKYLSIRGSTVGLTPFFHLLRVNLGHSRPCSQNLTILELCVHIVVGLQNDLIGVERDIATREWMNYAVVYAGYRGDLDQRDGMKVVESGIHRAVERHNFVMKLAIEH
jgi:hypothetical protein